MRSAIIRKTNNKIKQKQKTIINSKIYEKNVNFINKVKIASEKTQY